MTGDAGSAALRELLLVVAVAAAGLLFAMMAAFAPWHPAASGDARAELVELHSPVSPPDGPPGS